MQSNRYFNGQEESNSEMSHLINQSSFWPIYPYISTATSTCKEESPDKPNKQQKRKWHVVPPESSEGLPQKLYY